MANCVACIKGNEKCGKETEPGNRYCEDHKYRPLAAKEKTEDVLSTVIDASEQFKGVEADQKPDKTSREIQKQSELGDKSALIPNDQRNIYEKTNDALNRVIEWENKTWMMVSNLEPSEMRYLDKTGAEQLHSFVQLNERAQDRIIRATTAVAKLNIDAQNVNVNKMVRELVKSCMTKTFQRMGLDEQQINEARIYLAEEFEKVAGDVA